MRLSRALKHFDWGLFLIILILITLGLVAIYSVDLSKGGEFLSNFRKQVLFVGIGLLVILVFAFLDWRLARNFAWVLYLVGWLSLVAVLILGQTTRGAAGWFSLGGFNLQPVEFAKIFFIIALAVFFSKKSFVPDLRFLVQSVVLLGLYLVPVLLQPDLGGAVVLSLIWLGMLIMARLPRKYLLGLLAVGAMVATIGWFFFLRDYQKDRLLVFLDPARDPLGRGYNVTQSLVAIGAGGLWGQGLGGGSQSQLRFLPEAHTDFIFAVLAEELGFIAAAILIIGELLILYRLWVTSRRLSDNFSLFLVTGTILLFGVEFIFNIGMNLALLPVAGLTLPLVSYGGSSLISKFILLGVVQSMRVRSY